MVVRYVAFLRAINVGGHTVRMEALRRLFEEMGVAKVETFIASGNVIFDSDQSAAVLERRFEAGLEQALQFPVATFLRSVTEVAAVARSPVFAEAELSIAGPLHVGFLKAAPAAALCAAVAGATTAAHRFAVHGREIYWLRVNPADEFEAPKLDKALGPTTFRNMTSVRKLAAKLAGGSAPSKNRLSVKRSTD